LSCKVLCFLIIEKFENIKVGEICEVATIRRATFYKFFGEGIFIRMGSL
jgi:hypothetical protein